MNYPMELFNFYKNIFCEVRKIKIVEFLFQKNLWTLDFITSICFATYAGYLIYTDSDMGNPNSKTHWDLISYDVLAYIITFVLAIILQRKITWMRSWAWLGIVGALMRILMLVLISFQTMSHDRLFLAITVNWFGWAVIGLIFIFTVRLIAYIPFTIYRFYNGRNTNLK